MKDYKKKYEQALDNFKKIKAANKDNKELVAFIEHEYPELIESDDEKIRKGLIQHLKELSKVKDLSHTPIKFKQYYDVWTAWLEKQGKQMPTDKVEPKFKVGDVMRTLQEASDGFTDGMPVVVSIDDEYYHCTNELIAIKNQYDYEYPPVNRRQKSTWSREDSCCYDDICEILINLIHSPKSNVNKDVVQKDLDWLKSLKERMKGE